MLVVAVVANWLESYQKVEKLLKSSKNFKDLKNLQRPFVSRNVYQIANLLSIKYKAFIYKNHFTAVLAMFLFTKTTNLVYISGGTFNMILIAISTLVSTFTISVIFDWILMLVYSAIILILIACVFIRVWFIGEFKK